MSRSSLSSIDHEDMSRSTSFTFRPTRWRSKQEDGAVRSGLLSVSDCINCLPMETEDVLELLVQSSSGNKGAVLVICLGADICN
ncbi:hypothetical protein CRG98_024066 [Punica granatum]|uniref:Uncharacterized protein n=1 Tax=Punica granatum TaxID=22663 RepID=A0A2I0JIY6_PUNGR|nr:hypothetical protein CRG98_024066 [Punica granatum]